MSIKEFHEALKNKFLDIGIDCNFKIIKEVKNKKNFDFFQNQKLGPYKNILQNRPLIFVVTVFRMEYPYKDEYFYKDGLERLILNLPKHIEGSYLRIYYDDSIQGKNNEWDYLIDLMKKTPYVEMIKFDFPFFKVMDNKGRNIYHEKLFGTFPRFFPMFDFGIKIREAIFVIDIDLGYNYRDVDGVQYISFLLLIC